MKNINLKFKVLITFIFLFFGIFGLAKSSWAATYYVDPETGNDVNVGSLASPWANLPGTVGVTGSGWPAHVAVGDVIYVKGGTTTNKQILFDSNHYSGASSFDSIQIISGHLAGTPWGTGRAIIDGQNTRYYGIGLNGAGVTIDGFEIRNIAAATNSGVCGNGSAGIETCNLMQYNEIRRCYIHDTTRSVDDTGHGIETSGGSQLIIEYNEIGPNIGTKGIEPYTTNYGVIRYNFIHDSGDHNICLSGNYWDVYNNLILAYGPWAHDPISGLKINGQYNDVWNNLFLCTPNGGTTAGGFGIEVGTQPATFPGNANRFVHNTIDGFLSTNNYGQAGPGIVMSVGGAITNNLIANNIAINSHNTAGYIQLFWGSYLGSGNLFQYNDLWHSSASEAVVNYGGTSGPGSYTVAQFQSLVAAATNNQQINPAIAGGTKPSIINQTTGLPDTNYYALTTSSPAAVKTTNNSIYGTSGQGYSSASDKFSKDILGNARTNWSMGAYEYVSGGDTTPPAAPQGLTVQ